MHTKTEHKHSTPLLVYLAVGGALLFLTVITVAVSYVDLGPFNLVVAIGIATFKAMLVALFFMHLYYDNKLFMAVFISGLMFLGIFIILTMFDTMKRDMIYEEVAKPIRPNAIIYEQPAATDQTDGQH
ncbi:MAG: cytochrome C oxidase subunit IV family protein [candidate division KSB1 bacterium]|nr:cytochrome C oxidase subunit IV family protein [candidate division KSB1 bacterium]MDQ7062805.1 cytochrome C oxidase subunit IV family protein [candidate division KSB1 bacterium]